MPAKRVLISIDQDLLERIDTAVARRDLTRSGYLAQLAARDLEPGATSVSDDDDTHRVAGTVTDRPR
jgi:metal-responsive CopG/Arc/MetJ family transcriptional regulator